MWHYGLLDIFSTMTEVFVIYVLTGCFCREPRFQKNISQVIPPVLILLLTVLLTFFTDIGAVKIFIIFFMLAVLLKICYVISAHKIIVVVELSYLVMIMLPESIGTSLMDFIYDGNILTTVGDTSILKWQIYVVIILIRCVCLAIAYGLLRNFTYGVQPQDVVVLSISFLMAFGVSVASTYGYLNLQKGRTLSLDLITSVLSVCFIVQFLYSKNVAFLREQEQRDKMQIALLQQQFAYYQGKLKDEEKVRAIYHDMKNHLLVLEGGQGADTTRKMAEQLRLQIADYENYVHTGNDFLDIIIKDKSERMREKQIDFSAAIDFNDIDFMEPLDMSTIFGNGIDNAIEASERLPVDQRVVLVKAGRLRGFMTILIENNCVDPDETAHRTTTKADDFLHGFGIPNMQKAAEKYGGTCTTAQDNGTFTLKVLIPMP